MFLLLCKLADATHIVGGEIYYDYLGGNNYKITMKVYRDCLNGIPPFDNPAFFSIYKANQVLYTTLNVSLMSSMTVPPTNNSPCAPTTAGSACVEEAIYETVINLPPSMGGYYIVYQRCCRNGTILNLINPGDVGATYWEHIPGPEAVAVNSSPRFTNRPPIYICNNVPIRFDHVATDPDGDSLVYSLCTPFNGLDACCPVIGTVSGGAGCPSTCPTANTPPPYVSVPFASPYTSSYPMASNPAININPVTGYLNGSPSILGQWVVGVCVSEYRHGQLIGTHHRDFQFNVISCPLMGVAGIRAETTSNNGAGTGYCNGFTIHYSNASQGNNTSYFWDFGDVNSTSDTSYAYNPTYTFNTVGIYTVTLVTNPGNPCSDTTRQVFHVYPLLSPSIITPTAQCVTNNSYFFSATGTFMGTGTFAWNFGNQAVPPSSSNGTVTSVHFNAAGSHTVSLTINENGCTATTIDTIMVHPSATASMDSFEATGCDPLTLTFPNLSTGTNISYLWHFSDGTTSTDQFPTHIFTPPGVYSASLTVVSNQFCMDTSRVVSVNGFTVFPVPTAGFVGTPTVTSIFEPDISFLNTSTSANIVSWNYVFGDGASSSDVNPFHSYTTWGEFNVTQTVTNASGCPSTATLLIRIIPEFRFWVPNAFTPGNDDGLNDLFKPIVMGVEEYTFTIFDRWGALIYKTNDPEAGWNGTYKNGPCKQDVYIWKCDFKNVVSKEHEFHIGHVTLIR